jgi:phosphatidate cytidylyltransferase
MLNLFHQFLWAFVDVKRVLNLPFDEPTAWLIATVMLLLILASAAGKLLDGTSEQRLNTAIVRSFNQRIRSWWLMSAVLIAGLFIGEHGTVVLFGLIGFWALREFITMTPTRRSDHRTLFWVLVVFTPLQFFLVAIQGELFLIAIPIYASLFIPARIAMANDAKRFLERSAKIQIGLLICVYALSFAPAILYLDLGSNKQPNVEIDAPVTIESAANEAAQRTSWSHVKDSDGNDINRNKGLLFFFVLITQLNDVLQYAWGKLLGKNIIAPRINTSRTWEGVIGGAATSALLGALFSWVTPFLFWQAAIMAIVISFMGFAGGMTMSAIKRDRGVKDYGTLVQGHAGILDRIDSLCFAAPVFYHLTKVFFAI